MDTQAVLNDLWTKYISSNDEKIFQSYIKGFVSTWEPQLNIYWNDPQLLSYSWMWKISSSDVKVDAGPHLSTLPDELLPAIAKFIFVAKDETEKGSLDAAGLKKLETIVRSLIIICRNFDNIPFVASCEYVSLMVGIAATVIHQELAEKEDTERNLELELPRSEFLSCFCCFLECLYDPYLTWRDFVKGYPQADPCDLPLHSALLHMEVIPFIYDCFQTTMMVKMPWLCSNLLHILGGTISAAQSAIVCVDPITIERRQSLESTSHSLYSGHNGLRAICPATINVLMEVITHSQADESVCLVGLKCFTIMAHVLQRSSPEERQIEVAMILQLFYGAIKTLLSELKHHKENQILPHTIYTISSMLNVSQRVHDPIQESLIEICFPELIVSVLEEYKEFPSPAQQNIAVICVNSFTKLLSGNQKGKEKISKCGVYEQLFDAILSFQQINENLLKSLILMAKDGKTDNPLENALVVVFLLNYVNLIESSRQKGICSILHQLCTSCFLSKVKACREGVIRAICQALSFHDQGLTREAAVELIHFLEDLMQHSVTPLELKELFHLLRTSEENLQQQLPYRPHVFRALSSAARKGDHIDCSCYLDIQADTDGISVPGIKKWPGIGNCLAFHAWIRLDSNVEPRSQVTPTRRQLFSFYTSGGSGFEIFFAGNGDLTVAVSSNKDYSAATVSDIPLTDGHWHCLYICHMAARRPFGQNHLSVYIDGTQRLSACLKFPSLTDPYIYCRIGSIVQRSGVVGSKKTAGKSADKDDKESDGLILPKAIYSSLNYLVPSYLGLPSLVQSSYQSQQDPHVKSVPAGAQDTIWGPATSLRGHLGQVALFHDCLSGHQIKTLHCSGPDFWAINAVDDTMELTDLTNKLVLCYSPSACWNHSCPDLAPGGKHSGHVEGILCRTQTVKDSLNGIGGIVALIPLLENAAFAVDFGSSPDISSSLSPLVQGSADKPGDGPEDLAGWEVLPRSSFSDWKLEQNPVSGFLTLLRNIITRSAFNQESLLKNNTMGIIGSLLSQCKPELIDVNVLMAVQLLVEMAHDCQSGRGNPNNLLQAIHRHLLFDFRIWSRSQFQIRIGHLQYLSTVVKEDRRYFRKNYGVQFTLDVIRRHYMSESIVETNEDGVVLSVEDLTTVRRALFGLVKYYMQKDVNVREVNSLLSFLVSIRDEHLVSDALEMLISILGNKKCRDQIFLLLYERHAADNLYGLLVDKLYSMDLKQKVLRLLSILLRTDRVRERNKRHLRLQDIGSNHGHSSSTGLYPGLICHWQDQGSCSPSMEVAMMLLDQMLSTDSPAGYAGTLSLLSSLHMNEDINIRIEAARKVLTTIFMVPNAAKQFATQVGWQECICRLLIRKPINADADAGDGLNDLISFGEEREDESAEGTEKDDIIAEEIEDEYEVSLSSLPRLATSVTDAACYIENEVKEVAGNVTSAVADNIYSAADNISSAVASAYSVIRQKTLDMQGPSSPRASSPRFFSRSPFSLGSLRAEADGISANEKRSLSCSSEEEDESSIAYENRESTAGDTVSLTSALSISAASDVEKPSEDERTLDEGELVEEVDQKVLDSEAIRILKALDEEKIGDQEEELCYLVVNILFTILWRGIEGSGKDAWKERGQVLSCINMVGLNNELLCSHLELRRQVLELALTASLSDLRGGLVGGGQAGGGTGADSSGGGQNSTSTSVRKSEAAVENAVFLMRWVYDLVVLDPHEDGTKKASTKLLNGVLGHLEILLVFREGHSDEWIEMAKIAFGILISCAANDNLELCAMATAKLHALVQTRVMNDPAEGGFLLYSMNNILQKDIERSSQDRYSFLIPVIKALLEKLSPLLGLGALLPNIPLTQSGPVFFEEFRHYCQTEEWTIFVESTIRGLRDAYQETLTGDLTDAMNTFWAECYEASKIASNKRIKEVAESRIRFEAQIMDYYRSRQIEDIARHSNLLNQEKNYDLLVKRVWHHLKQNLISPRGAWRERTPKECHWKLSRHENSSRMRLKLCPNLDFNPHTEASNLRDNSANIKRNSVGWVTRLNTDDIPHSMNISAAVCHEVDEENAGDEDIRSLMDVELEGVKEGGKEKMVLSQECDLVTLMSVVKGRLEVTTAHISFTDLSPVKEDVERQDFKWPVSKLKDMYPRRYNLRRSAIEFFLTDHTNYFLNFTTQVRNKVYSSILSLRPPNLSMHHARSPADLLKSSGLVQKWVNREINNFDYLMQLNTIAGRTYNDLSQYPVFPWILADYTSEKLDLENPESFRNLSKPIGVVNPKNEAEVKAKYDSFEDPTGTIAKFHYGTHYSNSAGVLHYLVRLEPFTTLHIELQSGRFDVADRQFHSIPQTWKLLMDNPNDVKELIPEFFYMPEFLTNHNGFDLGHLQGSKEPVKDVTLPKWASSPEDFIYKHRDALESEYVSAHLHEWIDLIFGYKQKGPKAVEALNVFYYCSYEGAVDLDAIANSFEREAVEGMINNFGQTPSQLLHEPHPERIPLNDALLRTLTRRPDLTLYLERICSTSVQLSNERDPLVFVSSPRSPPRGSFLQTSLPDTIVTVTQSGVIGLHSWVPHGSVNSGLRFTLDIDPSTSSTKYRRKLPGTFHPGLTLNSKMFAVSHDGKLLFSVGHWDSSLHVYSLSRNRTIAHSIRHFDLVTCVALDECGSYLITGSRDTTCVIWDISGFGVGGVMAGSSSSGASDHGGGVNSGNMSGATSSSGVSGAALVPVHKLHGHDAPVTCVAILTQLDMAASGSMDGTVNIYTIQEGQYIRTLPSFGCNERLTAEITNVSISNHGHVAFAAREKGSYSLHVYSINGQHLGSEPVPGRVSGLAVIGGGQNYKHYIVTTDDAGDLTLRTVLRLKPVFEHPLHVPIESLALTSGNTHLLLPARDGQLFVIGLIPGSL